MATEVEWAYAAGVIDSDGCIGISRERRYGTPSPFYYRTKVRVTQSDLNVLMWFKETFGGYIGILNKVSPKYKRPVWNWYVNDSYVEDFLNGILSYLILKKPQAQLALEFRETKRGQRGLAVRQAQAILKNKMHDLNQHKSKQEVKDNFTRTSSK